MSPSGCDNIIKSVFFIVQNHRFLELGIGIFKMLYFSKFLQLYFQIFKCFLSGSNSSKSGEFSVPVDRTGEGGRTVPAEFWTVLWTEHPGD